jgi:hypothetical protein
LQREFELLYIAKEGRMGEKERKKATLNNPIHGLTRIPSNVSKMRQEVSVDYLKPVPDHMWSYNQHNARNVIKANWRFMKNLMACETGASSSSGLNGAFLAIEMATEF